MPLKHTSQAFVLVECNAAYVDRRVLTFGTTYWSHFQGSNTLYIFHFFRCHSGVFHTCDSFHVFIFLTFTLLFRFSMPHAIFSLLKFSDFCAPLISWLLHFIWRTSFMHILSFLIFALLLSRPPALLLNSSVYHTYSVISFLCFGFHFFSATHIGSNIMLQKPDNILYRPEKQSPSTSPHL